MDIALIPNQNGDSDISIVNNDLLIDDGFNTAVYISLFTDARDETVLSDKRGYWGIPWD